MQRTARRRLEAGQGQQLRDHPRRPLDAGLELAQRRLAIGRIGRLLRVLGVNAEHRQRCAQLVCRIGEEAALALEQGGHLLQQAVERGHQRLEFLWHVAQHGRGQVVRAARLELLGDAPERAQSPADRQPHQQRQQRQADEVGQQAAQG
jgi:hypothetical protein